MKRWQARGVVEDSEDDDDELSLSAESPSPERPRKRQKQIRTEDPVEDATRHLRKNSNGVSEPEKGDEDGWTQSKVARMYRGRAREARPELKCSSQKSNLGIVPSPLDSSKQLSAEASREVAQAVTPILLNPAYSQLTSWENSAKAKESKSMNRTVEDITSQRLRHLNSMPPSPVPPQFTPREYEGTADIERVPAANLTSAEDLFATQCSNTRVLRQSSPSSARTNSTDNAKIGEPPAIQQPAFKNWSPTQRRLLPLGDLEVSPDGLEFAGADRHHPVGLSQDLLSSPLSERDVSPPRDWTSQRPAELINDTNALWANSKDIGGLEELGAPALGYNFPKATATRTFRTRKPIQLHPFQLEKMAYMQNCKARGLRAVVEEERESGAHQMQAETQMASSQSQEAASTSLMQNSPKEVFHQRPRLEKSLDYFATVGSDSSDDEHGSSTRLQKRRRTMAGLDSTTNLDCIAEAGLLRAEPQQNDFDVPLSPPGTASDASFSGHVPLLRSRVTASGFIIPAGLTPAAPLTPEVSSDSKRQNTDQMSSSDPPSRTLRKSSTQTRGQVSVVNVSSSSSSSAEESAEEHSDLEAQRILREKKRIRGVLPASWLRIDFNAQRAKRPPSPSVRRRLGNLSSPRLDQQKGVARRIVSSRLPDDSSAAFLTFSRDTSDSDESVRLMAHAKKQPRLPFESERLTAGLSTIFDDEDMENDFIDPMPAGSSRKSRSRRSRAHQPRITDSFVRTSDPRDDFSEERSAYTHTKRIGKQSRLSKSETAEHSRPCYGDPPVCLSIADAPMSPSQDHAALPQFVRLALRRTRQDPQRSRHSPTHKAIRLTTAADSEEAFSVLRAWKAGSIAPRSILKAPANPYGTKLQQGGDSHRLSRTPLAELSSNQKQSAFSTPVLKSYKAPRATIKASQWPRLRQAKLNPISTGNQSETFSERTAILTTSNEGRYGTNRQPLRHTRLRNAQLETLQTDFDHVHRGALFERRIQCLTEHAALLKRHVNTPALDLGRYIRAETEPEGGVAESNAKQIGLVSCTPTLTNRVHNIPYRPRKRRARKTDICNPGYQQLSENFSERTSNAGQQTLPTSLTGAILRGLGGFGTRYPVDFGMTPLQTGAHFQPSSFIGSGDFADALRISERELDRWFGKLDVLVNGGVSEWSLWTEDVASDFAGIPSAITEALQMLQDPSIDMSHDERQRVVEANIDYLLRSVVRYCSKCLWFADPIDREPCILSLQRLVDNLIEIVAERALLEHIPKTILIHIAQYQLVIATQTAQLCRHHIISPDISTPIQQLNDRTAILLSKLAFAGSFATLRTEYDERRKASASEEAQTSHKALSSIVILNQVLQHGCLTSLSFWQVLHSAIVSDMSMICSVNEFENLWHNIFTVLPGLELDAFGNARTGSRLEETQDGSSFVKPLVSRVLELYEPSSQVRGYPINDYVRTTLLRCYCLATMWGWRKCQPLLNTIYDFFSRRNLTLLHKEEAHGSPKFLEDIDDPGSLEVLPDERSFHIFLKLLLASLRQMHKYAVYEDRKIQSIAYRLLPNHGRTFRRDTEVKQRDLDALRNHYDILCTLYCAMPPGYRIALDGIRSLIDHAISHREACRISVRAWANITSFQASTSEPLHLMESLSNWFRDMFETALTQYRLAKSEAENDYMRALKEAERAGANMPSSILESTIANNQVLIAETIVDALAGLKRAVSSCSNLAAGKALVEGSQFWTVLDLFDSSQTRLGSAINEALQVINTILDLEHRHSAYTTSKQQVESEDSQDFGDFSALEEFIENEPQTGSTHDSLLDAVLGPVWHFLSNVFGADRPAQDSLLRCLVDTWVRLAKTSINQGKKAWINYVDEYSRDSWRQMRDTTQKRKFTTYFMSRVLEESDSHEEIQSQIVTYWFLSLVEREAMIKFQNILTSSLLDHCPDEPLLQNLPFTRNVRTGNYQITLEQLRQRRLALISSVLCNMREHYEMIAREQSYKKLEVKNMYAALLRQLMQTMRTHYLELQTSRSDNVADANVQGAYVKFVQQVVSFLQQHTANICPVDHFFTDSAAFPLPATDPTYVVGKLCAYIPNLHDSKSRKALAIFVQSVSERALIDGQQQYLVDQMCTAMKGAPEQGDSNAPSLRHVLLTSVVPAYIENALAMPGAWILVLPMLKASVVILPSMLYNMDLQNERSIQSVLDILAAMLHSVMYQFKNVLAHADLLGLPHALETVGALMDVCASCFTLAQYLERTRSDRGETSTVVKAIYEQALAIKAHLAGVGDRHPRHFPVSAEPYIAAWPDARAVTDKQIYESLNENWKVTDGRYFLRRGNTSKEVTVQLDDVATERKKLSTAIEVLCQRYEAVFDSKTRRRQALREDEFLRDLII